MDHVSKKYEPGAAPRASRPAKGHIGAVQIESRYRDVLKDASARLAKDDALTCIEYSISGMNALLTIYGVRAFDSHQLTRMPTVPAVAVSWLRLLSSDQRWLAWPWKLTF
ncbi:hypothetical protein FBZ99_12224 [Rhizobium sp. ERR 1071]|nr:hypothetical protein FBZ99_12224 [Rhizobium sp. ERR1071]